MAEREAADLLPELPEPATRSLAYSGRDVEYIEGYESGFESALECMRSYGTACFEAGVKAGREVDLRKARATNTKSPRALRPEA
jgi:hypothetical protein